MADEEVQFTDTKDIDLGYRSEHRLHALAGFSLVFAARRVLRGENFDLHYRSRDRVSVIPVSGARLGLVIAKKLVHHAVQRNLLKRLVREAFRHARQGLPSYDLILRLSKSPSVRLDGDVRKLLRADVDQLLIRLPR